MIFRIAGILKADILLPSGKSFFLKAELYGSKSGYFLNFYFEKSNDFYQRIRKPCQRISSLGCVLKCSHLSFTEAMKEGMVLFQGRGFSGRWLISGVRNEGSADRY